MIFNVTPRWLENRLGMGSVELREVKRGEQDDWSRRFRPVGRRSGRGDQRRDRGDSDEQRGRGVTILARRVTCRRQAGVKIDLPSRASRYPQPVLNPQLEHV
jgi:hypothetical protein